MFSARSKDMHSSLVSFDLTKHQKTPRDWCVQAIVIVRTRLVDLRALIWIIRSRLVDLRAHIWIIRSRLVDAWLCVYLCVCVCVCVSLSLFRSLSLSLSLNLSLSPFLFILVSFSRVVSLSLLFSLSLSLRLCVSASLCLCVSASLCLCVSVSLWLCTHLWRISSNSIHTLDKMSGSTPSTVIHTSCNLWQAQEFELKQQKLYSQCPAPEFPRKKEIKLTGKCSARTRATQLLCR